MAIGLTRSSFKWLGPNPQGTLDIATYHFQSLYAIGESTLEILRDREVIWDRVTDYIL